jgi:TonB family protein
MSPRKKSWRRYLPHLTGVLVVVLVALGLVHFVKSMLKPLPQQKKMVREFTLIAPPPPPPQEIVKLPEPEVEEEVQLDDPQPLEEDMPDPMADDAPMGEDLALDAEGVAGGDSFGLLARKGGRDLIGSSGSLYTWYATTIQADILGYLSEDTEFRKREYSVKVQLWVDQTGRIKRTRLRSSTGDKALDKQLLSALEKMEGFSEKPPEDLPQPINIQVTSRI